MFIVNQKFFDASSGIRTTIKTQSFKQNIQRTFILMVKPIALVTTNINHIAGKHLPLMEYLNRNLNAPAQKDEAEEEK